MRTPIPQYLQETIDAVRGQTHGELPAYIPGLGNADPDNLALALCTVSGHVYSAGDDDVEFTIQSISKPFVYAMAVQEWGMDIVLDTVGMEPSGEAFNELSLHSVDNRPVNPMINAGAIAVNQLINGVDSDVDDRVEVIRQKMSDLAGRELVIDEGFADAEIEEADRNLSLAHMLRSYGIIDDMAHDAVDSYTRQCSILVTVRDLAVMAATLANGGVHPVTEEVVFDVDVCQLTLSVMGSAGMYDSAGRWMATVGIPAKSGVSGGLLGTLPGQLGLASLSPNLDPSGNSVRGVKIFEKLSDEMGLHLMSTERSAGVHAIRTISRRGDDSVVTLQGVVNFSAAEAILHTLVERDFTGDRVVLDFSRVVESNEMGRYMLKEGLGILRAQGYEIAVVDPDDEIEDRQMDDGTEVPLIDVPGRQ